MDKVTTGTLRERPPIRTLLERGLSPVDFRGAAHCGSTPAAFSAVFQIAIWSFM